MNIETEYLEKKFLEFRDKLNKDDWNNPNLLRDKAIELECENIPLAYRIMQRAHNLRPSGPLLNKKLKEYRVIIKNDHPELLTYSSENSAAKFSSTNELYKLIYQYGQEIFRRPIVLFVFLPWFLFFIYQSLIASDRFESSASVIVKQPDAGTTLSPEMAFFSGMTGAGDPDGALVESYIFSYDLIDYLNKNLDLKAHYSDDEVDFISRLSSTASKEDFINYYEKHVSVELDIEGGIITISVQAYSPIFAQDLNKLVVERTEWFINEIGHRLAKEQLTFINNEHKIASENLKAAQTDLLTFQQKYNLLDPETEGAAMQSIAFGLEQEIASKNAELKAYQSIMSNNSSEIRQAQNQLVALKQQLKLERERLSAQVLTGTSVSQILSKFSELKVNVEMSMQAYSSSLVSLEKSRIEAYRQLKYLVTIQNSVLPEENKYPQVWYNVTLFGVLLLLVYGIIRIVVATILELS